MRSAHYTNDTCTREVKKLVSIYRQIQILTCGYNKIFSAPLVSMLLLVVFGQIAVSYQMIKLAKSGVMMTNGISLQLYGFCASIMTNGIFTMNLLYGVCADVHQTSKMVQNTLRRHCVIPKDRKEYRLNQYQKLRRALPVVRINFGSTGNFIEKLTPVVYQEFAVKRLIDALCVS